MENLTAGQPDSPFWVSLVQTAGTLPIALLSIVAGVLADTLDRRKLLLWCNVWMLVVSAVLAAMTFGGSGVIGRNSLLVLTTLLGIGAALAGPAFQYVIPELVPPSDLPLAISLNSVALNIARAVGPALAGAVIAIASMRMAPIPATGTSFVLNAVAFIGVVWVLARWKRGPQKQAGHRETMWGATKTAFAYTAHSPALRSILIRVAAFILCAVIVWAQLIIIAKRQLATGATPELKSSHGENLYYILMACVGAGAVVGVIFMPKMDKRFSTEGMVAICTALFGVALIGLSQCTGRFANIYLAGALSLVIGFNWVIVPTNFNIATQRSVPGWIKGRAIAMYMTVLFGSFAVGSPIWGSVATRLSDPNVPGVGISRAALIAGTLILAGLVLVKPFPLTRARGQDFGPAGRTLAGAAPAEAARGPFVVLHEYRVPAARAKEARQLLYGDVRRMRRRNGAGRWQLRVAEVGDQVFYEESFAFWNWADRVRAEARVTKADAAAEAALHRIAADGGPRVEYRALIPPPMVAESRHVPHPVRVLDLTRISLRLTEEFDAVWNRVVRGRFRERR
jgi:MFS family permease